MFDTRWLALPAPSWVAEFRTLRASTPHSHLQCRTFLAEEDKVTEAVYHAIKTGYRHIDCASIYGNETAVGAGIARAVKEGIVQRSDLWVTSKLWIGDTAPANVAPALQRTLDDLGLEYLDLYLIHWPFFLKDGTREVPPPKEDIEGYNPDTFAATWA